MQWNRKLHFRLRLWLVASCCVFAVGWFIPINVKGCKLMPIWIAIHEDHLLFPVFWAVWTAIPSALVGWLLHHVVGLALDNVKDHGARHAPTDVTR
jgi:hypothetical protein